MSDLVKRLRSMDKGWPTVLSTAADRIEELERELAIAERMAMDANEAYSQAHVAMCDALDQLAAEKALADRLYDEHYGGDWYDVAEAYRKARGCDGV